MAIYQSPNRDPRDLKLFGPRFEIKLGPPILHPQAIDASLKSRASGTTPRVSSMPALIDTGAQRTVVSPEAIAKVGLSKINETKVLRLGGFTEKVGVYVASIQFPRSKFATIEVIEVASCELPHPLIRCLLGRDILSRWVFTYNGPLGAWDIKEESVAPWIEPPEGIDLWGQ